MSRLAEKLAQAKGAVGRVSAKIETNADGIIAREAELNKKTDETFSGHFGHLDDASKGLDELARELTQFSNGDPSQASIGSRNEPIEDYLARNKITLEEHNAAIAAGHKPESRYYFEYIEKLKADGK